jgi:hypothetical protein
MGVRGFWGFWRVLGGSGHPSPEILMRTMGVHGFS